MRVSKVVLTTHGFIPKSEIPKHTLVRLRQQFTVVPSFGERVEIRAYKETADWFGIPMYYFRGGFKRIAGKIIDKRVEGDEIDFRMVSILREEQLPVYRAFQKWLKSGKTGLILSARPGFGKTVMITRFLADIGRTALVVVNKSDLLDQWVDRLLEHTNLTRKDIGIVRQNVCEFQGKKVVVGMLQSLLRTHNYPKALYRWPGVLVVDEVHVIGAPYFSNLCQLIPAKYRIGASATVERRDGASRVFEWALGEHRINASGNTKHDMKLTVAVVNYMDPEPIELPQSRGRRNDHQRLMQRRGMLIQRLVDDPARNLVICKLVRRLYDSGRKIAVLSDRVAHLQLLRDLLSRVSGIPESDLGLYIGSVKPSARERVVQECKVLLATYGMLKLGTDIPDLAGLVIATPQSTMTQAAGRVLRIVDGKKDPVVVDLVDMAYGPAVSWFRSRLKDYQGFKEFSVQVKRVQV